MDSLNTDSDKAASSTETPSDSTAHSVISELSHLETRPAPIKLRIVEPKERKAKIVAITASVLLVFVSLAGGAFLVLSNYSKQNTVINQVPVESKHPVAKTKNAKAIVSSVMEIAQSPVYETKWNEDSHYASADGGMVVYTYPLYQLKNSIYITEPNQGYGAAVSNTSKEAVDTDYAAMIEVLEKKGFKKTDPLSLDADVADGSKTSLYVSDTSVCKVSALHYPLVDNSYTSISCADKESYVKQVEVIEPFYKLLLAQVSDGEKWGATSENPLTIKGPLVADGKDGYKRAVMGTYDKKTGTLLVLYYQEPGGQWQYAAGTNQYVPITCNKFNTSSLKKAFVGFSCYDTTTDADSTVEL